MNKQKGLGLLNVLLAGLLFTSCTWQEVQVKMQFAPKVGDVYHVSMVMEQAIVQTMDGQETNIDQTIGFGFSFAATETDENGNVWVDVRYEWVQIKQTSPTTKIEYDSRSPSDEIDPVAKGYAILIGKGYSMQVSPSGEVLDITGIDTLMAELLDNLGADDEALRAQLEEQFKKQFSKEALKEQAGNLIVEYPEGVVKIGDTWKATSASTGLVPMSIETTYTLLAYDNGIATIGAASTISPDAENSETDMGMYKIRYNLSGAQDGTINLDTTTGWSASSAMTQTVSGDMVIVMGDTETTVQMSLVSNIEIEMSEK